MKWENAYLIISIIGITLISLFSIYFPNTWGITTLVILLLFLLLLLVFYEKQVNRSKEIALISILGAFSATSRIPFAALPSIQPCTFIIFVSGYVFGPFAGFFIGMETALLSNFFLGQGPWTPWQMLAWGAVGIFGWVFRRIFYGRKYEFPMALFVIFLLGYFYGIMMNLWYWLAFISPHTWQSFLMVMATSIWFDTLHALGNLIFMDIFFKKFIKILERYKLRFSLFSKSASTSVS